MKERWRDTYGGRDDDMVGILGVDQMLVVFDMRVEIYVLHKSEILATTRGEHGMTIAIQNLVWYELTRLCSRFSGSGVVQRYKY